MAFAEQADILLAEAFGKAAVQPDAWIPALRLLAEQTGSSQGQLIGIGGANFVPFNWVTDLPDNATEKFIEINGGDPGINYRVAAHAGSAIVFEDHYDQVRPNLKSEIYFDFVADYDIPYGIQTDLREGADGVIGLAVLRTQKDGRSTPFQREIFARAARHAAAAVRVQLALDHQAGTLVAGMLDAMRRPAILLDERGDVQSLTPSAEDLLARTKALRIEGGRLVPAYRPHRDEFEQVLACALVERDNLATCRTMLIRGSSKPDDILIFSLTTLPIEQWSLRFRPRVIVTLRDPRPPEVQVTLLQQAYGLTGSEAAIAAHLMTGMSRSDIAAVRGVSVGTILTQIRSLFHKTGVSRESELVVKLRNLFG